MNIEDIQNICKELPGVTEDIKWGNDLVFSIGGKMFCVAGLNQSPTTASFKVTEEEFEEMCDRDGFKPAPYVAKYKWVWIEDIKKMSKAHWKKYIKQSYDLVKEKLPAKGEKAAGAKVNMSNQHNYSLTVTWTGNRGTGTSAYTAYDRSHTISVENKPALSCSSDASFRGDKTKYTPEDLLVASISGCHMLWYLHLCSEAGVVVIDYNDNARGTMIVTEDGGGHFTEVTLFPEVTITDSSMEEKAIELHRKANQLCFIANSCNFPIHHKPTCKIKSY